MATANELLAGVATVDKTLVVSNDFRTIGIPSSVPNLGVEYDDDVLCLDFKMPRYVSNTDLSTFSIRINYINSKGESDAYTVRDAAVGSEYITFSWLVGPTATRYKGDTKFNICAKTLKTNGVDDEGNTVYIVDREFNTTIATLPVLEGLEVEESIVTEYSDIIEQWKRELFGIGDTEEASIKAVSQAEQKAITDEGARVLATIPADYATAVSMTDNADRTKSDAIVSTRQGESITVSDSSDDYLRGLKIFGKTAQVTTTGKQLININQKTKTNNGIVFTPNLDGSVHVKGTATANAYFIFDSNNSIPVMETELVASISGSDQVYMVVGYFTGDGTVVNSIASVDDKTTSTFTYPATAATTRTFLGVDTGKSVDATVYPLVRLASDPDDSYEPYTGGIPSPNPEYPQELKSIESPTVYIYGKNVLGANATRTATLVNGVTFSTVEGSSEYVFNGTASGQNGSGLLIQHTIIPPGTYTCSVRGLSSGTSSADYINMKVYNTSKYLFTGLGNKTSRTFTIEESTEVLVEVVVCAGSVYNNSVVTVQLETGTSVTNHERCVGQQQILIDNVGSLPAIPVSQNGNYTDENDQQWICDEVDFERGVYVKRVGMITLTGTGTWQRYSNGSVVNGFRKRINDLWSSVNSYTADRYSLWSNYFSYGGYISGKLSTGIGLSEAQYIYLRFDGENDTITTIDELTTWLAVKNSDGNPVIVKYPLATPIETPLTQEEIERFRFAHTNFPNTTVLNDAGATMELKYNADTKTYLDNITKQNVTATISNNILILK